MQFDMTAVSGPTIYNKNFFLSWWIRQDWTVESWLQFPHSFQTHAVIFSNWIVSYWPISAGPTSALCLRVILVYWNLIRLKDKLYPLNTLNTTNRLTSNRVEHLEWIWSRAQQIYNTASANNVTVSSPLRDED